MLKTVLIIGTLLLITGIIIVEISYHKATSNKLLKTLDTVCNYLIGIIIVYILIAVVVG